VGALTEEAQAAESRKDFAHKLGIALKEARESHYWLRQLRRAEVLPRDQLDSLVQEAKEIKLVVGAIIASTKGTRKAKAGRPVPDGRSSEEAEGSRRPSEKLF
jgi:hypothetical protein